MLNPWLGMGLVATAVSALAATLHAYQRWRAPHPELVRKLFHIGIGMITLSLPWLFAAVWPVLILTALSALGVMALRAVPPLRQHLGSLLHGVARPSLGDVYFPVSAAVIFTLSRGDALLFSIPILILTLADAVAALIGMRYGALKYTTADETKSAEGSIAFFTVAFLSTHLPLLLSNRTGRIESVLIGLILGLLVMLLEAIAWRGLDNVFIPLGGYVLLKTSLEQGIPDLAARLGVSVALVFFVLAWRHRTTLDEGALLGAALVGYVTWALGGWRWMVAPFMVFVGYALLSPQMARGDWRLHDIHAVVSITSASLIWLFLARTLDRAGFLYPYTLAFAAHLAIMGVARLKHDYPQVPDAVLLAIAILKSWLLLFLPFVLLEGLTGRALASAAAAFLGVGLAALAFYATQPSLADCPTDAPRWVRQAGIAATTSTLGLVPLYLL